MAGGQGSWRRGEKDRGPDPQRLGLKSGEVPGRLSILNWCTRVRIQERVTIKGSGSRGGSGEARGSGARRTLPGSLFPFPAVEPGRRSLAGPEGGQDRGPDPGAPHVRKGPSLQPTTGLRPGAHRQLAVPRTILSLGAIGLVWPEDFFLRQKKGK